MQTNGLTPELISALAGILLSLGFSYVPGLADWFERLGAGQAGLDGGQETGDGGTRKRLVMLALLAIVSAGAFALACGGLAGDAGLELSCDRGGASRLAWSFILAVVANQSAYRISPRPIRSGQEKSLSGR